MRPAVALAALLLLAGPATAHIDHPLPRTYVQENRDVSLTMDGAYATIDLRPAADPLRDVVRHVINPTLGTYSVEYRPRGSGDEGAFHVVWNLPRFVEYRDVNDDLRFDPGIDALVRTWRMEDGRWTIGGATDARIGSVKIKTVTWTGVLSNGPRIEVAVAAAGRVVRDEGALAVPNDVLLYVQIDDPPPRATGHLYAFDANVDISERASATEYRAPQNITTAIVARDGTRMAYFQWGGEAIVDGTERTVDGWLGDAAPAQDGGLEHPFRLSFPILDRSVRLVIVSGLEALPENKRADAPTPLLLLACAALVALARRRVR